MDMILEVIFGENWMMFCCRIIMRVRWWNKNICNNSITTKKHFNYLYHHHAIKFISVVSFFLFWNGVLWSLFRNKNHLVKVIRWKPIKDYFYIIFATFCSMFCKNYLFFVNAKCFQCQAKQSNAHNLVVFIVP